jgi:hypothetical protein
MAEHALIIVIFMTVPVIGIGYWNYVAWFRPNQFEEAMQRWRSRDVRFKQILGPFWWSLNPGERVMKGCLMIQLVIVLIVAILSILQLGAT